MNTKRYLCFVLLALSCLASSAIYAQDSLNISSINQYYHNWRDGVSDVAIRGDYAFLACHGDGFRIVNMSQLGAAYDVSHFPCYFADAIAVAGDYAYVGCSYDGIRILDISDPAVPREVRHIALGGTMSAIRISGNHAFVCSEGDGLIIIDITDPPAAQVVWNSSDFGSATDIEIHGNTAYVACQYYGMLIFNISQIDSPELLGSYSCNDGEWVNGASVSGNYAYLACGSDGFRVIDLTTLQMVASIDTLRYAFRTRVVDTHAYLTYGNPECPLAVIDVSNPLSPQISGIYFPPQDIVNFTIVADIAYVADFQHGLRMVDISNPQNPHEDYRYSRYGCDWDVTILGSYAYVQEDYKLKIIDITDTYNPSELGYYEVSWETKDLKVVDNIGYLLDASDVGLYVIDLSNPYSPNVLGTFTMPNDVHYGVAVYDHYAYVLENYGLRIIDVADPGSMQEVGFFNVTYPGAEIIVYDHYAIVHDRDHRMMVLDLSDPISPTEIAFAYLDEYCTDMKVADGALFVTTTNSLWIFDATSFQPLTLYSRITIPSAYRGSVRGVDIYGKHAYLAVDIFGLCVYDVTNRATPRLAGYFRTPGSAMGVAAYGNVAAVADVTNLGLYDCSRITSAEPLEPATPQAFTLMPNYPNPFNSSTHIQFELPKQAHVTLTIFDVLGRSVSTVVNGEFAAGTHTVRWDGTAASGQPVASSRYYVQAKAGDITRSLPILLLK